MRYFLLSLTLCLAACKKSPGSVAQAAKTTVTMEARIAAAPTSDSSRTIEEELEHMPEATPGREKVIAHLAEVKKHEESPATRKAPARKKQKAVLKSDYSALDGNVELKSGIVNFRGRVVDSDDIQADFEELIKALKGKYAASEIVVSFHEPDTVSVYRYPTVAIRVIFVGNTGKDIKIGREIARTVYVFSYPLLKKAVRLDVCNKPRSDWAEKFSYSYMIPPGTDPDAYSAYLFSKDPDSLMKDKRWVR
jgi:hypothetical protein